MRKKNKKLESGWMACCKYHFSQMIKDLETSGYEVGWSFEEDSKIKCDYPKCKKICDFEMYFHPKGWFKKILKDMKNPKKWVII